MIGTNRVVFCREMQHDITKMKKKSHLLDILLVGINESTSY